MSALLYSIFLQWKMNLRNKELFVVYYVVPIVFFLFMGAVFTSIMPNANQTLIQSMTIFGVTMGGVLGSPSGLTEIYRSDVKKSYVVGHIPLWSAALTNFLSGFLHLFLMSMIIFILAPLLYDATYPADMLQYMICLLLLISTNLAIGTLYGLFIRNSNQMNMMTQMVFLPSIMLSGIMFPANLLPSVLGILGKLFPTTWIYEAMLSTSNFLIPLSIVCIQMVIFISISWWKCNKMSCE